MPVIITITVLETKTGDLYLESKSEGRGCTSKEHAFSQGLSSNILASMDKTSKEIGCDGMLAVEGQCNPDGSLPDGFKTQVEALRKRSGQ